MILQISGSVFSFKGIYMYVLHDTKCKILLVAWDSWDTFKNTKCDCESHECNRKSYN